MKVVKDICETTFIDYIKYKIHNEYWYLTTYLSPVMSLFCSTFLRKCSMVLLECSSDKFISNAGSVKMTLHPSDAIPIPRSPVPEPSSKIWISFTFPDCRPRFFKRFGKMTSEK